MSSDGEHHQFGDFTGLSVRRTDAMPYDELDRWGRYLRVVRAGGPTYPSSVCKSCFNLMTEKGYTCSDECQARFEDKWADDHGYERDYENNPKPPSWGLVAQTFLLLALAVAVVIAGYFVGARVLS